jgi:hypothetical protein
MDSLFSLKGKEAMFVSGLLGVFIYFAFMNCFCQLKKGPQGVRMICWT